MSNLEKLMKLKDSLENVKKSFDLVPEALSAVGAPQTDQIMAAAIGRTINLNVDELIWIVESCIEQIQ